LVTGGSSTLDEMFLCYFIYANYEEGDEEIIMDDDLLVSVDQIQAILDGEISIYPNPASDFIKLAFNNVKADDLQVVIYDGNGKVVHTQSGINPDSKELQIETESYSSGKYYIQLSDGHSALYKDFVIE